MTKKHHFQLEGNDAMSTPMLPVVLDIDGELRTTSVAVAVNVNLPHPTVIKLVRRYQAQMTELGALRFEVSNSGFEIRNSTRGRHTEFAFLNEDQAAFLMTLMRNSEEVVRFKLRLVKEFSRMKAALQSRHASLWQQLQTVIAREVESKVKASFGSHLMLKRKAEKPSLEGERLSLESRIQPGLWLQ